MLSQDHGWNKSLKPLFLGFTLSLLLLVAVFRLESYHDELTGPLLEATLLVLLAFFLVIVQFVFFLHLGLEAKPHWRTILFIFMLVLALFVIGGSLWIMDNLNYNMMPDMGSSMHPTMTPGDMQKMRSY